MTAGRLSRSRQRSAGDASGMLKCSLMVDDYVPRLTAARRIKECQDLQAGGSFIGEEMERRGRTVGAL